MVSELCPVYAPFIGSMGCVCAIVFTCFGAAYGTAKAGVGVCSTAVLRPDLVVKNIVPVVMAGIIGIYGLVVSVLVANDLKQNLPLYTGLIQLCTGLSVGLAGLASGFAIGVVGDAGVRGTAQQPRLYVGMILILIFAEVLGLYGLIVALLMNSRAKDAKDEIFCRLWHAILLPVFPFLVGDTGLAIIVMFEALKEVWILSKQMRKHECIKEQKSAGNDSRPVG